MRILYIEDEGKVAGLVKRALEEEGFEVDLASDGELGCEMARARIHQLLIVDQRLPSLTGREICQQLRSEGYACPILFLSALDSISDTVAGLNSGADDYLSKPFALEELIARVHALARRISIETALLQVDDLTLNPVTHEAKRGVKSLQLSAREYRLLEYLMRNPETVLTRAMIVEHVWEMDFDPETNVVDVYINYVRGKINLPGKRKLISTVRGIGYRLT